MDLCSFARRSVPLCVALLAACGAGAAPAPGPSAPAAAQTGAASPSDAGAPGKDDSPATTTVALGDGGDLQGTKLTETHTTAASPAAPARPPKAARSHDVGRSPQDIRAIIQAHRDEARACYDDALADHPGVEGDLVVKWTIDPKGNVTQASLDPTRSQIVELSVVSCVCGVIKKIQFAASQGGYETEASYPFNFHPHHPGYRTSAPGQ